MDYSKIWMWYITTLNVHRVINWEDIDLWFKKCIFLGYFYNQRIQSIRPLRITEQWLFLDDEYYVC